MPEISKMAKYILRLFPIGSLDHSLVFPSFYGLSFVVMFFSFPQPDFHFRETFFGKKNAKGDDCVSFFSDTGF